jgi:hypothetical protein
MEGYEACEVKMVKSGWRKGALIGGIIFIILVIIYYISGLVGPPCIIDGGFEGNMCTNYFQGQLLGVIFILSFPSVLLGIGSPNMSTFGPMGVALFWIVGFIVSLILGGVIGWLIGKIRKKK